MHEMALAESAVRIVEDAARREGARRVALVVLEIGRLAAVEAEALAACFAAAARGGPAAGARLEMDEVPGRGRCPSCAGEWPMDEPWAICPQCATPLAVCGGDAMRVREIEIEEGS